MQQPSTKVDWERVVTPLRRFAKVFGILYALAFLMVNRGFGSTVTQDVGWDVAFGVIVAGVIVSIVWTGIGEVIGGLTIIIGTAIWFILYGIGQWGAFAAAAPFLLVGLLFIACGWYTLAHRHPHAHVPA